MVGAARLCGANHVHHALRGAVDRVRARGKDGDADRVLVLLDRRRAAAVWLCALYPRSGLHPRPGFRRVRLCAQPVFRVARPAARGGRDVAAACGASVARRAWSAMLCGCSPVAESGRKIMTLSTETTPIRRSAASAVEVIPTGAALAAELRGVDLKVLDAAAFARLVEAWHKHSVLLIRGQALSDQDLIAFSRRLGDLDWAPIQENGRRFVEGMPEIYIVSNVKVNGEAIGS